MRLPRRWREDSLTYLGALIAIWLTLAMVRFPEKAFEAAVHGLGVWFEVVFPALLPFFIGSEILMGLGVVHFMGVLLEPLMRPLFNVPGTGSFVLAMGLASGYPIGAVLTSKLRSQNLCTQSEAERLVSFTNTADPLFMIGAVGVGMFGSVEAGNILSLSHYLGALLVGMLLRFYAPHGARTSAPEQQTGNMLTRGLKALTKARIEDGRPFGRLLGDAIGQSVKTLLLIGGFIILFSVITQLAAVMGTTSVLADALGRILTTLGINPALAPSTVSGLFEVTIGCDMAAQTATSAGQLLPLKERLLVTASLIGWSGLSVHFQVAAMLADTDVRMPVFVIARVIHGLISGLIALAIFPHMITKPSPLSLPAFATGNRAAILSYRRRHMFWIGCWPLLIMLMTGTLIAVLDAIRRAYPSRP